MERETNKYIALAVTILAVVAGVIVTWLIGFLPFRAIEVFDNIPIRILLVIVADLLVASLAFTVFLYFHYPRPRRLILSQYWLTVVLGLVGTAAPFSFSYVERISAKIGKGFATIDFSDACSLSGVIVIVSLILAYFLNREYTNLAKWERKNGALY